MAHSTPPQAKPKLEDRLMPFAPLFMITRFVGELLAAGALGEVTAEWTGIPEIICIVGILLLNMLFPLMPIGGAIAGFYVYPSWLAVTITIACFWAPMVFFGIISFSSQK